MIHAIPDFLLHGHYREPLSRHSAYLFAAVFFFYVIDTVFVRAHYWKTDHRGIIARKLLWGTSILWSDIREVRVRQSPGSQSPSGYRLVTSRDSIWIPVPAAMHRQYALLLGSIRQHLRHFELGGNIQVPSELDDLWWRIPDTVPASLSWINTQPEEWRPLWTLLLIKAVGWAVLVGLGIGVLGLRSVQTGAIMFTVMVGITWSGLYYLVHRQRTTANSVAADDEGLSADTGYGSVSIRWSELRSASWGDSGGALKLSGKGGKVRIPSHSSASELLLSIVRRLREMKRYESFPIPSDVLCRCYR